MCNDHSPTVLAVSLSLWRFLSLSLSLSFSLSLPLSLSLSFGQSGSLSSHSSTFSMFWLTRSPMVTHSEDSRGS
jgi:hypothetical protein